jgi:hypothetical protein
MLSYNELRAQKKDDLKKQVIERCISSHNYVFKAQSVLPTGGMPVRQLTSDYDLKVSPDSVISYLPYFGKSYSPPMSTDDAGIMFTSTGFDYTAKEGKKRTWEVEIKFKDQRITQKFNFTIYDNGTAYLQVTGNSRDPISFRGSIKL